MESLEQRITEFQKEIPLEGWRSAVYSAFARHPSFSLPLPNFSQAYDDLNPSTEDERLMAGVILALGERNAEAAEIIAKCYQGLRRHPDTLGDFLVRGKWDFSARDYSHMGSRSASLQPLHGKKYLDVALVESIKLELIRYGNMAESAQVALDECWRDPDRRAALEAYLELSTILQGDPYLLQDMIEGAAGPVEKAEVAEKHITSLLRYLGKEIEPSIAIDYPPQTPLCFSKIMISMGKERSRIEFFDDWDSNPEFLLVRGIFEGRNRGLTLLDIMEFMIRREEYNGEWALAAL